MRSKEVVGVIVARFQVDEMHSGHRYTVNFAYERHERVMTILGVPSGLPDDRNPLSFELRRMMLQSAYAGEPMVIVPQRSRRQGNEVRSAHIDQLIEKEFPGCDAIIYGARDSIVHTYTGKFPTVEVPTVFNSSATEIRKNIRPIDSPEFRAGVIWSTMERPAIGYPTVDIALLEGETVWLGRKRDEELYRFIGGFYDIAIDDSIEAAAYRELHEEAEDIVTTFPVIIGSKRIDDWRYKRSKDGIITTMHTAQLLRGTPKASDDIVAIKPFLIKNHMEVLVPEHKPLGLLLLKHLNI